MANTHLDYPDIAIDKISGTNLDQDADSFFQRFNQTKNQLCS